MLFDLFETLISEWRNGKREKGHMFHEIGLNEELFKKEWHKRLDKRMDGTFSNYRSVLIDILRAQNMPIDLKVLDAAQKQRERVKSLPFEQINEEIIGCLSELKRQGIKVGLISNCTPEEISAWEACTLSQYFDDVIFSYKVKCAKPNPEIYLMACKNLKVEPEKVIFIGDGGSNELFGAEQVGMIPYQATWFLSEKLFSQTLLLFKVVLTNNYLLKFATFIILLRKELQTP